MHRKSIRDAGDENGDMALVRNLLEQAGVKQWKRSINVGDGPEGPYRRAWLYDDAVGDDEAVWENFPGQGFSNVCDILEHRAKATPDYPGFGCRDVLSKDEYFDKAANRTFEKLDLGDYRYRSWSEVLEEVKHVAVGLGVACAKLPGGKDLIAPGTKIAIYAETSKRWMMTAQAVWQLGCVGVTVYTSLGVEPVVGALNQSAPTVLFAGIQELKKLAKFAHQIPSLKLVVLLDDGEEVPAMKGVACVPYADLVASGKACVGPPLPPPTASGDDLAMIMYTSGTTGMPKGVMITHTGLIAGTRVLVSQFETGRHFFPESELPKRLDVCDPSLAFSYIAFLPLAHIFEITQELCMIYLGIRLGYATTTTLIDNAPRLKPGVRGDAFVLQPSLMCMVPAIMERIKAGTQKKLGAASATKRAIFAAAIKWKIFFYRFGFYKSFVDSIVFKSASDLIGSKMSTLACGGAPLNPATEELVRGLLSCVLTQGYGLTETAAAGTSKTMFDPTPNDVGAPSPGVLVMLRSWEEGGYTTADKPHPRGEILISGKVLAQGYFQMPEATAEVFYSDASGRRWFCTGDIGEVLSNGNFRIIDRKKDLVKQLNGEYVSLNKVETAIKNFPFVEDILVHVDSTKMFPVAILLPKFEETCQAIGGGGGGKGGAEAFACRADLCGSAKATDQVLRAIQRGLRDAGLTKFEIPHQLTMMDEEWTPENGMLTPTLKLKRVKIVQQYKKRLEAMHSA